MEAKPLIKQGWIRAMLFAISFLILIILANLATDRLISHYSSGSQAPGDTNNLPGFFLLIRVAISLFISVVTIYFFRKLIDRQNLISLGLQVTNNWSHAAAGFFLGLLLLGAGTFLLIANKNLQWIGINFDLNQIATGFFAMILVAFAEELVFRGYILNNLMQSMNKWVALISAALIFAVFHLSNPGSNLIAILNVFLAGILLGINYIFTKNLWFGVFFHFSWNFYQGAILGYKVSGVTLKSLFDQNLSGNQLLTGGPFGFEGSIVASVLTLASIVLLGWRYRKIMVNG